MTINNLFDEIVSFHWNKINRLYKKYSFENFHPPYIKNSILIKKKIK